MRMVGCSCRSIGVTDHYIITFCFPPLNFLNAERVEKTRIARNRSGVGFVLCAIIYEIFEDFYVFKVK